MGNWNIYGPTIDIELWPERVCGVEDTLNMIYNAYGLSTGPT